MGLSASQARMLTITSRLSDLELRAQNISNSKIRLSQESGEVSKAYAQALDQENFQILTGYNNSGSGVYSDVTYNNLMNPASALGGQYCLTDQNGSILVDNKTATNFENANGDLQKFLAAYNAAPIATTTTAATDDSYTYNGVTSTEKAYNDANGEISKKLEDLSTFANTYGLEGYNNKDGTWSREEHKKITYSDADIWKSLTSNVKVPYNPDTKKDVNGNSYSADGSSHVIKLTETELYGSNGKTANIQTIIEAYVGDVCNDVGLALSDVSGLSNEVLRNGIAYAKASTIAYYKADVLNEHNDEDDAYSKESNAKNAAKNGNGIGVDYGTWGLGGTDSIYIDQTQVVMTFLNYFDSYCARQRGDDDLADACLLQIGNDDKKANRDIQNRRGNSGFDIYISESTTEMETYNSTSNPEKINFTIPSTKTNDELKTEYTTKYKAYTDAVAEFAKYNKINGTPAVITTTKGKNQEYYTNLFEKMSSSAGYFTLDASKEDSTINNSEWLSGQIENGALQLEKVNDNGEWESTSWGSDTTNFTTNDDDAAIAKAEAQYEIDMNKIETKDKRYDLELNNIDTEHSALQTEKESVQKVIEKNIDRAFKIFDA